MARFISLVNVPSKVNLIVNPFPICNRRMGLNFSPQYETKDLQLEGEGRGQERGGEWTEVVSGRSGEWTEVASGQRC